jgi:predicted nuclease of predicted toxin-antitoxin system
VKLLFDHLLSTRLIRLLHDLFPGSNHVYHLNLHEVDDPIIWDYARENEFIVASKDVDFSELSMAKGFPPKLLWLKLGNCRTGDIENSIRDNYDAIREMNDDPERGILILSRKGAG